MKRIILALIIILLLPGCGILDGSTRIVPAESMATREIEEKGEGHTATGVFVFRYYPKGTYPKFAMPIEEKNNEQ